VGFPIKKDKTFLFAAFEGLRQNAQNAVPLLTDTNVFRPTAAQNAIIGTLETTHHRRRCLACPAYPCRRVFAVLLCRAFLTVNRIPEVRTHS